MLAPQFCPILKRPTGSLGKGGSGKPSQMRKQSTGLRGVQRLADSPDLRDPVLLTCGLMAEETVKRLER